MLLLMFFCATFKQCGLLVGTVEYRHCQKRMTSFPEGSVFTRLSFCLFVLLGTAVLLKISDLQVEISLGSLEDKMVFHVSTVFFCEKVFLLEF